MYDWYSPINKYFVYPLYFKKNRDNKLKRLKQIDRHQYLPRKQLEALQWDALKALLNHAYRTVPYYQKIFDERKLTLADFRSVRDLQKLPVLTKTDLQNNQESLLSTAFTKDQLIADSSGGSTGKPTVFYKNKERERMRAADQVRHDRWSGWDIGDPFALIWGAQKDLGGLASKKTAFITKFVFRIEALDAFDMCDKTMQGFRHKLEKLNPPMILGYANALKQFAAYLDENAPRHRIRPKGIISSAETLTEDGRSLIERVFQCPVLNRYGSREVGLVASECPNRKGLHINADNVVVEILNGEDPVDVGESGDIVVTDLWNYGMPFIRYRMEDRGSLMEGDCGCGITLPLMGQVEGRVSDFLVATNGTLVHGEYFTHLFYGCEDVRKFQIVQETEHQVILRLVMEGTLSVQRRKHFVDEICSVLGRDVDVEVRVEIEIPPSSSGKHLFTISKIHRKHSMDDVAAR